MVEDPKLALSYLYTLNGKQSRQSNNMLYGWGKLFMVPVWQDAVRLDQDISVGDNVIYFENADRRCPYPHRPG